VQIHSSIGYLCYQFFNGTSNHRTDEYTGSKENRATFFFEVLETMKETILEEKIKLRFNLSLDGVCAINMNKDRIPTFESLIKKLNN
jgi:N-ethylmaleimide reductase